VAAPSFIAITSGDSDGIGLEVTCKALSSIGPQRSVRWLLTCSTLKSADKELRKITGFKQVQISSREIPLEATMGVLSDLEPDEILVWRDSGNEAAWVKTCAQLALEKKIDAIVTGPVSKARFKKLDSRFMGHTGLFAALAKTPVHQGYVGSKLCVVLATDHVPLSRVERSLTKPVLQRAFAGAETLRYLLSPKLRRRPIAALGLNPHAGESGLIGSFESRLSLPKGILGPLPADTAMTSKTLSRFSVIVAMYHDQGLIPFKLLHGQDSGFQISLGLPFVRTSVDHGTAKDLFGRGRANPGSMVDALRGAMKLTKARRQ